MVKKILDKNNKAVAELLKDEDIQSNLSEKTIAVLGYASQGKGQSLCYRDSGINTILGLRKSKDSWKRAKEDGWQEKKTLFTIPEAVKRADIICMLIADTAQQKVYENKIRPNLTSGKTLMFSHGFNIHFKQIIPEKDIDVIMVAPKGPGFTVREMYEKGFGVPALVAVSQDCSGNAMKTALSMAKALGASKPGVLKTTFKDEVESDLLGEQVDLCGGITELVKKSFETLVEAGYNPLLAYFEVHHELYGLIAPLAYRYGNVGMLRRVSLTARKGAVSRGSSVIDEHVKDNIKNCLNDIQSGKFAKEWIKEYEDHGFEKVNEKLKKFEEHLIEQVGKQAREIMWPNQKEHI
ncbi:ketol-acid reductoisomerase [Candidatus Woesearchaeota archaeon]|nr:ketol-acid reductoisomerase [Candidatus Woesearchaeota archaeon]